MTGRPDVRSDDSPPTDMALARAQEILGMWREGHTIGGLASALHLPAQEIGALIRVLVPPEEREAVRARKIAAAQQRFSDRDLIEMLRACADEKGRTPGCATFDKWAGHFWAQLFLMRFGSWANACVEAGLEPHVRPAGIGERTYSDEDHLRAYRRIKKLLNGQTVTVAAWSELALPDEPKEGSLRRRYGTWRDFKAAMEEALLDG